MKTTLISLFAFVVGFFAGSRLTNAWLHEANSLKYDLIKAYEEYYDASEEVLDTLDAKYGWVDCYDFKNYFDSRSRVDSIYATQQ